MRKLLLICALWVVCIIALAQAPLTFSKEVKIDTAKKGELLKAAQPFLISAFDSNSELANNEDSVVVEGIGEMQYTTVMLYASIVGKIHYKARIVFKDGSVTYIMTDYTHEPMNKAAFNNNMGVLVAQMPEKLSEIGITGANRKSCYKYFFKTATPLCKSKFDTLFEKLVTALYK